MQTRIKKQFQDNQMITLPSIILERFDQLLGNVQFVYTKWLRFHLDFCHEYHHNPFHVDSLPLFLKKLPDKQQSEQHQQQTGQAVSLHAMQVENTPSHAEKTPQISPPDHIESRLYQVSLYSPNSSTTGRSLLIHIPEQGGQAFLPTRISDKRLAEKRYPPYTSVM